ncbi:NYN domain-containing protein [Nocardioides sp.]|uniref:NYN domain-containing protein n=2 Tax=Nocardioides sp. TaxID=35761 RepID=UPI0032195C2D
MRSNCALYVDAGYLLASAATRVSGTSLRNGVHVEYGPLVDGLIKQAEELSGLPLLRVHWYDSAKDGVPDAQQGRIGELAKVKLRLGRFGVDGQQKGVDLRIGLDLVTHARNAAADVFLLVSGDDDLTEAVEEAQVHGVQVIVLGVPHSSGRPHGVSRHLVRAADELTTIHAATIDDTVMKKERPVPVPAPPPGEPAGQQTLAAGERPAAAAAARVVPAPHVPSPLDLAGKRPHPPAPPVAPAAVLAYSGATGQPSHIVGGYAGPDDVAEHVSAVVTNLLTSLRKSAAEEDLEALLRGRPSIPREIDKALLLDLSDALGVYDLNDTVRFELRHRFWELYDESA